MGNPCLSHQDVIYNMTDEAFEIFIADNTTLKDRKEIYEMCSIEGYKLYK